MDRTKARNKKRFIVPLLLLLGLGQQINGQTTEPRKLFPINDGDAFIDISGKIVISSSQPELLEEVKRLSAKLGGFRGGDADSIWIRFAEFSEGLAVARWSLCPMCRNLSQVNGFIDETGRLVIPPTNSDLGHGSFREGLARYFHGGFGFIDREGRVVIAPRYYEASDFSEGLARVRLSETSRCGYINQKGRLVIRPRFVWASDFHEGLAAIELSNGAYGFIDKRGKVVRHSKRWFDVNDFSEGLAGVEVEVTDNSVYRGYKEPKYGFIDRLGKFVIAPGFDRVQKFSEGRALFFQTGKNPGYGFIDRNGRVVIKPEYVEGRSFSEGLAAVAIKSSDDKTLWGYINREGAWVIKPQFKNVDSFNGGLAAVDCDENGRSCKAYIDKEGNYRWQKQ